ncbi:PREDICTED: uncharacterized protein LOC104817098, partial [Tarenaya hassleriana]|uniref:uncharacterized protein LOC104817098 n=1 Tax=Tarenaya hassleriana TaxID=28532 RepID=UPI00053C5924
MRRISSSSSKTEASNSNFNFLFSGLFNGVHFFGLTRFFSSSPYHPSRPFLPLPKFSTFVCCIVVVEFQKDFRFASMSGVSKIVSSNEIEKSSTQEEHLDKINEVRRSLGTLPEKLSIYSSDSAISRYL